MPPTSTIGTSDNTLMGLLRSSCARGFTLLEVLVVLVIVAVLASFVVANTTGQDRVLRLEGEARRLGGLIESALDDAMIDGGMLGLELWDERYRFLRFDYDTRTWVPFEDSRYAEHALADDAVLAQLEPPKRRRATYARVGSVEIIRPDILLLSSGEQTPFQLELRAGWDERIGYALHGEPFGEVRIERLVMEAL